MASFWEAFSGKKVVCCALTILHRTYITVGYSIASLSCYKYYIYDTTFVQKSMAYIEPPRNAKVPMVVQWPYYISKIIVWWLYNQGKSNVTWESHISEIDLEQKHGANWTKDASRKISVFELRKVCLDNSRVPVVHCVPLHPEAHVQVFGAVQVPPFWQGRAHTAV